jgi:RNA polymerase sigma factor (sigma-70 family)
MSEKTFWETAEKHLLDFYRNKKGESFNRFAELATDTISRMVTHQLRSAGIRSLPAVDEVVNATLSRVASTLDRNSKWDAEKGPLASWIYRIAKNQAMNLLRMPKNQHLSFTDFSSNKVEKSDWQDAVEYRVFKNQGTDSDFLAGNPAMMDLITIAIRSLPERQQKIVRLHYFDKMTQTSIAESLGIADATVHREKKRALARLKSLLA